MTTRSFDLGDILSVTTGILVSPRRMDGIYDLCSFMAGEPVWTHQLPRVARECKPELLAQHPDLAKVVVPDFPSGPGAHAAVAGWLDEQICRFGEHREVAPLAAVDHTSIDPVAELAVMGTGLPVITVEVPDGDR